MAKEKFHIIAVQMPEDCFGRFSETDNCAAIDAGTMDQNDPYAWIEASFELVLVRDREATHICSFTPSARQEWLQNAFVGIPNAAWEHDGDPEGLEYESGGQTTNYGTYRDTYDPRFICETFTIDTVKELGLRKPPVSDRISRRNSDQSDKLNEYTDAVWDHAIECAHEMKCNGIDNADILGVWEYRKWQKERLDRIRQRSLDESKRNAGLTPQYIGPF